MKRNFVIMLLLACNLSFANISADDEISDHCREKGKCEVEDILEIVQYNHGLIYKLNDEERYDLFIRKKINKQTALKLGFY